MRRTDARDGRAATGARATAPGLTANRPPAHTFSLIRGWGVKL